ncbi:MAG: CHAT domain-containing tetratricopeptide repeat protein [Bacteroidota bacterium]
MKPLLVRTSFLLFFLCFLLNPGPCLCQEVDSAIYEWIQISRDYRNAGKYDSAIICIEYAFQELNPFEQEHYLDSLAIKIAYYRATNYLLNGEYGIAEGYFEDLHQLVKDANIDVISFAHILNRMGQLKMRLGKYEESQYYHEAALAHFIQVESAVSESAANVYTSLGVLFSSQGDVDKARTYYQKALAVREQVLTEDNPQIAESYNNLGTIAFYEEDYEKAIRLTKKCFEIYQRIYPSDHHQMSFLYNNLGVMYNEMGNSYRAQDYHLTALEIRRKTLGEVHLQVARSYLNLGETFENIGDLRKAMANYQQYWAIIQKIFPDEKNEETASIYHKIGTIYLLQKKFEKAESYIQEAVKIYREIFASDHIAIGHALHDLGEIQRENGNFRDAARYFDRAYALYEKQTEAPASFGRLYKNKGTLFVRKGYYERAMTSFEKGDHIYREVYKGKHPERASLLNEKARAYVELGDSTSAFHFYQEALSANLPDFSFSTLNQLPPLEAKPLQVITYLTSLHEKALLHSATRNVEDWEIATQLWNTALHWLEKMQFQATYRTSKLDIRRLARRICEASIRNQIQLYGQTQRIVYLEEAFQLAEISQAALLHEWVKEAEARQQAGVPQRLVERVQDFHSTISYYEKKLYQNEATADLDSLHVIRYQSRLFEVRNALDSLVDEIEAQYPRYYAIKYQQEPLNLQLIQGQLGPDEQVIRYFYTQEKLYMFSLRPESLSYHAEEIDSSFFQHITQFYNFVRKNPAQYSLQEEELKEYIKIGHHLYQQVIAPILHEKSRKLYLIPEGRLNFLAFEALLSEPVSRFSNFSELPYLLKSYELSYAYSTRLLFSLSKKNISSNFMGFAPKYGEGSLQMASTRLADSAEIERLSPLRYNQSEAELLQTLMNGQAYLGREAREETFKQKSPSAGILHLAMHALTDDVNPLYSGLVFSQVDSLFDDNFLYTYELFNLHLNADLAVLSACNTGVGEIQRGEGMLSLAKGFQYAGCPNLVMSLWQTDDQVAFQLMETFYSQLLEGASYASALHDAKINYLETQDRAHPFYWATFHYIGQRTRLPQSPSIGWIVGILGVMGALGFFFRKKVKSK